MMGEGSAKDTGQRNGISTGTFYRRMDKVKRRLKKLNPIWVRFGNAGLDPVL